MTRVPGPFRWAALFLTISALLHLAAPIIGGFSGQGPMLAVIGLIYLGFVVGLAMGMRWLAYIVFLAVFIGLSGAVGNLNGSGAIPGWLFMGITLANVLTLAALFVGLWRPAPQAQA